jgi:DNA-binding PadR family transcriptional regulator
VELISVGKGKSWPSGKELEVLRLLQSASSGMYGLELVDKSNGAIGRASIYNYLWRLEEKGYVTKKVPAAADHPGMPRPIYRINGLGQKALAAAENMGMFSARARS